MQHCNARAPGHTTGCSTARHIIAHKLLSRAKQLLQSATVGLAGLIAHVVLHLEQVATEGQPPGPHL